MNAAPRPPFLRRAAAVIRTEGFAGVVQRLRGRGRRGWHAAVEASRWTAWKIAGPRTVQVNGYAVEVDPQDPGISRELALYRTHEPHATELAKRFAANARTIVDLGSNIGYYALLFLTHLQPRPRLVAIEPSSGNLARLQRNLAANGLADAATVLRAAISDRCGEGVLHLAKESNWHTLLPADARHHDAEPVRVVTLDALVAELELPELDLIRMDIEGYETVVFGGMREVLRRFRPKLIVELHPQLTGPAPILALLDNLEREFGYRVVHVVDREQDYAHLHHASIELDYAALRQQDLSHRCFTVFLAT